MPRYLVKVCGSNFVLKLGDQWERQSFFTHRLVNAPDVLLAEHAALEAFRNSTKYETLMKMALYADNDPPLLYTAEISEVEPTAEFEKGPPGLIFYVEDQNAEPDASADAG